MRGHHLYSYHVHIPTITSMAQLYLFWTHPHYQPFSSFPTLSKANQQKKSTR